MKIKHRATLKAIFKSQREATFVFLGGEGRVKVLGGNVREGEGSRVVFELNGKQKYLHRPHPVKGALKYQIEELRD